MMIRYQTGSRENGRVSRLLRLSPQSGAEWLAIQSRSDFLTPLSRLRFSLLQKDLNPSFVIGRDDRENSKAYEMDHTFVFHPVIAHTGSGGGHPIGMPVLITNLQIELIHDLVGCKVRLLILECG
jgi:hypothetical protein